MKLSPLQLRHYVLRKVWVEPLERWEPKSEDMYPSAEGLRIDARVDLGATDDENRYAIRLTIKANPSAARFPYRFEMEVEGHFEVLAGKGRDDKRNLAAVNGTSLLYGVLRENLLALTHRFEHGPALLPTLHFLDLKKKAEGGARGATRTAVEGHVARGPRRSRRPMVKNRASGK